MKIKSLGETVLLENIPFTIEEKRVLRELRIAKISSLKEMPEKNIARYIGKAIETAYGLIEARATYRTFEILKPDGEPPGVESSPGLFFGKKFAALLDDCKYVTLLLTTIGPKLPDRADDLKKAEPTDSFYLEHVGGWMADYLADKVDESVRSEAARHGYENTMRYSPGYGDWSLEAQPEMLRLTESGKIGVELTDTLIMIPRKSVSAAMGWKPKH